ncbi:hypothetical protein [Cucumibacter marinus]|uniref:hypothetical protein n=1 Tax=Cucumibacter marinus TaxID=1121252 RepID=UPI000420282C|nr:hypothetical protein [Cucumibacter marinus]
MTLLEEALLAARGWLAVWRRDSQARAFFGDGQRALVTSLIAVVVLHAVTVTLAMAAGEPDATLRAYTDVAQFAGVVGGLYLYIRAMGREPDFLQYLTASNWLSVFLVPVNLGLVALLVHGSAAPPANAGMADLLVPLVSLTVVLLITIALILIQFRATRLFLDFGVLKTIGLLLAGLIGGVVGAIPYWLLAGPVA